MKVAPVCWTDPVGPESIVVCGAVVSTVQLRVAGDGSTLPAASRPRTEKVCDPSASPLSARGDAHAAHGSVSSLHSSNPASVAENEKLAAPEATVPAGPDAIDVSGGVASTVHVRVAGDGSRLPATSVARTDHVCDPSDNPLSARGDAHATQAPVSSLHSKLAAVSVAENEKLAALEATVPDGPVTIDVSGGVVSTVQLRVAGDGSTLPAASTARTDHVCDPSDNPLSARGDAHPTQAPASRRHSKEPDSVEENAKVAAPEATVPDGPAVIDVSGGVVSTVHVRDAGDGSTLPAWSLARTDHVCDPSASAVSDFGDEQNTQPPASSLHSKLEPGFVDENPKLAELEATVPEGPDVIEVSGRASVVNDHVWLNLRGGPMPPWVVTLAATLAV